MKISGIYKVQSQINPKKIYMGSAVLIRKRWIAHLCHLRKNIHENSKLQRHFNKYGESDLQFSILLGCDKEDLIRIEQYFIDSYKPWFNICPNAGNRSGSKHSEETKKKISESRMGQIPWNKNKKGLQSMSEETRNKMSKSNKGKKHNIDYKGIKNPFFGKHHSPETIIKLRESHKGIISPNKGKKGLFKHTDEYKKKLSEDMKGEKNPMFGRKHSKDTIEKMIQSKKAIIGFNTEVKSI